MSTYHEEKKRKANCKKGRKNLRHKDYVKISLWNDNKKEYNVEAEKEIEISTN